MTAQGDDDDVDTPPAAPLPPVSFLDAPFAPDVFADFACGFFVRNNVVSITFASTRSNYGVSPAGMNNVVIGRLVMPAAGAQNLAEQLFDFLTKQGLAPKIDPKTSN